MLTDPLEREPPKAALPFHGNGHRVELDLGNARLRQRWRHAFVQPLEAALERLPARGIRVQVLASDAPSDAWLPAFGRSVAGSAR